MCLKFPKGNYKKKRASKKMPKIAEATIQKAAEEILQTYGIPFIRIPDMVYHIIFAGVVNIPEYIKIKIAEQIKSIPDLTLLMANGRYRCVELKTATGKLRSGQKIFRNKVGVQNYDVCRSVGEFVEVVKTLRGREAKIKDALGDLEYQISIYDGNPNDGFIQGFKSRFFKLKEAINE